MYNLDIDHLSIAELEQLRARAKKQGVGRATLKDNRISKISRTAYLPVSFAQKSLYYFDQLPHIKSASTITLALRIKGEFDLTQWQRSLDQILARHEGLRTVFVQHGGQLHARLLAADTRFPLQFKDLRACDDVQPRLAEVIADNEHYDFDLSQGPLIHGHLIQVEADEHVFLVAVHHIVFDGWSSAIFVQELSALYHANRAGEIAALVNPSLHHVDYVNWQNDLLQTDEALKQQAFWSTYLADIPALLSLPRDRQRPAVQDFSAGHVRFVLDMELAVSLRDYAQQHGYTLFMILIAAWGALLSRLSGQDRVVIGTPVTGRSRPEFEPVIGLFVNMLAIRFDFSTDPFLDTLLAAAKKDLLNAYDHQDLPFEKVVDLLKPERSLSYTPIYQTVFTLQSETGDEQEVAGGGLKFEGIPGVKSYSKSDLELSFTDGVDQITGVVSYARSLFDEVTIERYKDYLIALLKGLVGIPHQRVSEVNLLSETEQNWLLYDLNRTAQTFDRPPFFFQQFEEHVARRPQAVAAVYGDRQLSYEELNHLANQLAHALIKAGIVPEARIALCVERGFSVLVGFLGILKAGGVYVPMDAAYSSDRLNSTLEDASPFLVLVDDNSKSVLNAELLAGNTVWTLNLDAWAYGAEPKTNPDLATYDLRHLAYIIYTSGSTGKPKGVMVEHRNLSNFTSQYAQNYDVTQDSRVLQFSSISFDASIYDLTLGLAQGCVTYLLTPEQRTISEAFVEFLRDNQITHALLVPTMISAVIENTQFLESIQGLRICLGGEAPSGELVRKLAKNNQIFNIYGPTECTVITTSGQYSSAIHGDLIGLGRPIANTQVYILDQHMRPVPRGVVGELYIGGEGVARGYFQHEELTHSVFLPDPFAPPGVERRIYRTGDQGYHLATGEIVYSGRNDNQVKIQGFRIELGEIERQLLKHPQIASCAIIADTGPAQDKRLLAYVVSHDGLQVLSRTLREYLCERLPAYMVPTAFVQLQALPFNSNGKLDRKALPAPGEAAYAKEEYQAPSSEIEVTLMKVWQKLLGVEKIGRNDNFYALGGNSLLATLLASEAAAVGINLPLMNIIQYPVLCKMASEGVGNESVSTHALVARNTGQQQPVFFLPSGTGSLEYFYELAPLIDSDYPIYGLPWLSWDVEQEPTIEAMAKRMLNMVKQIQPNGPYQFLGYCSGAVAIHALSQLLLGQNEEVNYIGLIDALWYRSQPHELNECHQLFTQIELQANTIELDSKRYDQLRELENKLPIEELMNKGKEWQLIPDSLDIKRHLKILRQQIHYARLVTDYYPTPLDIDIYQFNATQEFEIKKIQCRSEPVTTRCELSEQLGWDCALPVERIHIQKLQGDHNSLVVDQDHRKKLGLAISRTLRNATPRMKVLPVFDPLIPFVTHPAGGTPLVCIPGAGASVTSLSHFIDRLRPTRAVYGLQPRGIEPGQTPHSSIQVAAADNLKAISDILSKGPIHLLGHSHGGLIALEMAHQLNQQGKKVASVTLIDSQAPRLLKNALLVSTQDAMDDFVDAVFNTLNLVPRSQDWQIDKGDVLAVLARLHRVLREQGRVPANSQPGFLAGSFHAYLAARRWTYESLPVYPPNVYLLLASDLTPRTYGRPRPEVDLAWEWRAETDGVQSWKTPGSHYSLLSEQHALELARLWDVRVADATEKK